MPWRRGQGYDVGALTNVLTADHAWAHLVVEEVRRKIADPVDACGRSASASASDTRSSWRERFTRARPAVRRPVGGEPQRTSASRPCAICPTGRVRAVFTVDLFNEGIDVPTVDTLLLLRPTESPTLFLQQLGRGLRKAAGKSACTVLDFVGTHRKEFRFDRRFRALLGGSRADVERQVRARLPVPPGRLQLRARLRRAGDRAGEHPQRDPEHVARAVRRSCARSATSSLGEYLESSGLELEDIYAGNHSWIGAAARGRPAGPRPAGPDESVLLRAVGRLLHVDDDERLDVYPRLLGLDRSARSSTS